jgi:hypothetical protein
MLCELKQGEHADGAARINGSVYFDVIRKKLCRNPKNVPLALENVS